MKRIAVVDDHAMVRDGLVTAVRAVPGVTVVLATDNTTDVMRLKQPPDLVLLDIDLGRKRVTPVDVAALLGRGSRVLIVSALADPALVRELASLGIGGFVPKQDGTGEAIAAAIVEVLAGRYFTTPALAAILANDTASGRPELSDRERRALVLYASGMKLESVGRRMGVTPSTAKTYIQRVRAKYSASGREVRTKTDLYRAAVDTGLMAEGQRDR